MFTYRVRNIKIEADSINEVKDFIMDLCEAIDEGVEYPGYISDFFFAVEADYQNYHDLDPDNWDKVH